MNELTQLKENLALAVEGQKVADAQERELQGIITALEAEIKELRMKEAKQVVSVCEVV